MTLLKRSVKRLLNSFGLDICRIRPTVRGFPPDFSREDVEIIEKVLPFTYTSPERIWSVLNSVRYISRKQLDGAIVECGVWKGGSMMAAMLGLNAIGDTSREFYLYDTYEGMVKPTDNDVNVLGEKASEKYTRATEGGGKLTYSPLDEVRANIESTGYPLDRVKFVAGKVEDTIPQHAPAKISLLRLDTDWYESTKHELQYLFPRLSNGGVLILDDYGHWQGAREAMDEYISEQNLHLLLNRIDYTGRLAVKN